MFVYEEKNHCVQKKTKDRKYNFLYRNRSNHSLLFVMTEMREFHSIEWPRRMVLLKLTKKIHSIDLRQRKKKKDILKNDFSERTQWFCCYKWMENITIGISPFINLQWNIECKCFSHQYSTNWFIIGAGRGPIIFKKI